MSDAMQLLAGLAVMCGLMAVANAIDKLAASVRSAFGENYGRQFAGRSPAPRSLGGDE